MSAAPQINFESSRKVGLELEYDSGSAARRDPPSVQGWSRKHDGSLRSGYEYVLEPCLQLGTAKAAVAAFCKASDSAKLNLHKSGGFHVHVQSPEFGLVNGELTPYSVRLAMLYAHFQEGIDRLVAKSRHSNNYCSKFSGNTASSVNTTFNLASPAESRSIAKSSRVSKVVNLAMCRTLNPEQRSIEFRQGSASTNFDSVWGWTCFVTFLVEAVVRGLDSNLSRYSSDLAGLVEFCSQVDRQIGSNIAEWVVWRDHYLNRPPTDEEVASVANVVTRKPHGIFHIARKLSMNFALAQRTAEEAARRNIVSEVTVDGKKRWIRSHISMVDQDIAEMEALVFGGTQ